jgi:hypothetical protein
MKSYILLFFIIASCQNKSNKTDSTTSQSDTQEVNNKKDSIHVEYYPNGNKKVMAEVKETRLDGKYELYNEYGVIKEKGNMLQGHKNGIWRYFKDEGGLIKAFLYNEDKVVFELDTNDYSTTKKVKAEEIEISLPVQWIISDTKNKVILLAARKKCSTIVKFCPNITISKEDIAPGLSFNDYVLKNFEIIKSRFSNQIKPVAQGELSINGLSSFQLTYIALANNTKLAGITTWIKKGNTAYIITGMAINEEGNEFLKYKNLFQEITDSFWVN